jgi:hypothetical protein
MNEDTGLNTRHHQRKSPFRVLFGWYWDYQVWWWKRVTKPSLLIPQIIIILILASFFFIASKIDDRSTVWPITLTYAGLIIGSFLGSILAVMMRILWGLVVMVAYRSQKVKFWSVKWTLGGVTAGGVMGAVIGLTAGLLDVGFISLG